MRLWIISELYYPDETATGYLLTNIAEGLAKQYPVHVICVRTPSADEQLGHSFREERNLVKIRRTRATHLDKNVLAFRIINAATATISLFFKTLLLVEKGDRVLVVTNPPFLPFVTRFACGVKSAACYLLIHDVYPDVLVASGILRPSSALTSLTNWLSRKLYMSVKAIVVLGRDMQRLVSAKLPSGQDRITIITNWGDVDVVYPLPKNRNPYLKLLTLQDKFVLQYAGNMGRTHGLENIVKCAMALREDETIHFLLIGSGVRRKLIERLCANQNLKNVSIERSLPRREQLTFLNACDVGIITFINGMSGISVPSRMYNIMAAGKPIIAVADEDSELAMVIREEAIGWVVPPDRPDCLEQVVREASVNPMLVAEMGIRARRAAEKKYPFGRVLDLYTKLFFQKKA